jgi:NADP+-dependent farnesol dehydrogenase
MELWKGKVAVVTGANNGMGFAILKKLAEEGMIVVGFDIFTDDMAKLAKARSDLKIHIAKCDVTKDDQVEGSFQWIDKNLGGVDVLINNAGVFKDVGVLQHEKPMADLTLMIDLNFTAIVRCTRLAFKSMEARDACGYIININSIHGHSVAQFDNSVQLGVYTGTKYGVTATTEVIRRELGNMKNRKVRVTSLSPGLVKTQLFKNGGLSQEIEDSFLKHPFIYPEDIANNITYLLSTPMHVNICEMTIRPTGGNI